MNEMIVAPMNVQVNIPAAFTVAELPPQWGAAYCVRLLMSDGAERRIALGGAHRPQTPPETPAAETTKGARS